MKKLVQYTEKFIEIILVLTFVVIVASMSIQVIGRELIGRGFAWTEELAVFSMFIAVYLGVILEVKDNTNISITILDGLLAKRPKAFMVLQLIQTIAILFFGVYISYYGVGAVQAVATQKSFNMLISMGIIYAFIPIAGFFMVIFSVIRIITLLKQGLQQGNEVAEDK